MAIGDIVATLSVSGASGPETFELIQNPGGYFAISGAEVVLAVDLPAGVYSIGIEATTANGATRQFVIQHTAPPSGVFVLGLNLSGAQAPFPQFPTADAINYHAGKLLKLIRLPFCWSIANSQAPFTGFVGAQPAAFGALDTTSTVYGGTAGYMGKLAEIVAAAAAVGSKCILDNHMFGAGPGGNVGTTACPTTAFADFWGKFAAYFVIRPALLAGIDGLDLMNEWPNGFDSGIVFTASQQAITTIRAAGYTGKIYVEGTNFSSAWNWTSGQGNPFNSSGLSALTDPLNNLVFQPHMYPDPDDSGSQAATSFAWAIATVTPGSAPPGLNTSVDIGVQRMSREFVPWLQSNHLRALVGEYGTSNDNPWNLGAFDYADWNTTTRNLLNYLQANNIGITLWSGGPGFGAGYGPHGYSYSLDPFNVNLSGAADFTSTGVQAPLMVVLDEFTGYSGPQPQAYMLFQPGLANPTFYCTQGTPSAPFTVYYGGKITSPVTITPHDTLFNGAPAGGTFTPSSVVLAPGENGLATFTYTASQHATLKIATTNSAGWHDPPAISFSSVVDGYTTLPAANLTNIYGLYNRYSPNTGPAIRLQRADGQQMDFGFSLDGKNFDRNAIQTWASQRSGIQLVTIYGIGPGNQNPIAVSSGATFSLQNAAGYPEINWTSATGEFNTPIPGQTLFSTVARINQDPSTVGGLYRMDQFIGPIGFGATGFTIFSTGFAPPDGSTPPAQGAINTFVTMNIVNGAYHDYGVSYASGVTNGFVTYKDGAQQATATVTYEFGTAFNLGQLELGNFRFSPAPWVGAFTNFELLEGLALSPTQLAAISSADATYYSSPLPDTLAGVNPTVTGAGARGCIVGKTSAPLAAVTITDTNGGGVTDSVTLTLSGSSGGTLSGTGLSGTGPYTIASGTAAAVTSTLQALVFTPSGAAGTSTTITIAVTSSAGTSASNASTVISVQAVAAAETAFAAPSGTFTPINKSGVNIIAAQGNYPDGGGFNHIYPQNSDIDYWASTGAGAIRVPLSQQRLQPTCYGALDPASTLTGSIDVRSDGDNWAYAPNYATGTQVNLAEIKRVLDRCRGHNMYVQLEFHQNVIVDTQNGINRTIGNDTEATNIAVDLWKRVATVFKNYDNAIFEYFNEPVASTAALNFTCQTTIAAAVAAITTLQWNYIPTNFFSGGNTYVSRGEPASWNSWTPPAGLKWALVLHQYLNQNNDGFTADVVLGKGASALSAAITSMRAAGIKAAITETGWSPSDTIVSPGTGVPSTEGNAILAFCKTNNDVVIGWNFWLGGDAVFEGAWNAGTHSVFSSVPQGLNPVGTIVDAPQVAIMKANFV